MDDEFDKPWLACQPCSEKLPMVLSGEGVDPLIQVPASIAQYLRDYQRDGVRFLYQRFSAGEGGILGDDMGLGKTIQAIAFMAALLQMKGTKEDKLRHCSPYIRNDIAPGLIIPSVNPILVVCPATLTDNWCDELEIWGHFKFKKITTSNRLVVLNSAKRREYDVLLITFETARSSVDFLNMVDWTCILVDEVHRIKDTSSQTSKALCSLRCQSRFGFTGTPFQNNMKEVWCLLNWSNPQSMCDLSTFTNNISRALERGNRSSADKRDITDKRKACLNFQQLKRTYMLRRTKEILAKHLPSKSDQVVFCELTDTQQRIYRMITQLPDLQNLLGSWTDKCSQKAGTSKKRTSLLFTYLHLLQKTANHVGLLTSGLSPNANDVTQRVCREALEDCAGLGGIPEKRWLETLSDVNMSGKMLVLAQLLPVFLEKGDKILIFSYSTKVLNFVEKHLNKMRYKFCRLDGTTPADARCSMVRSFNSSPDLSIFLLSTKAGGVGLNITGANVVIIYDPNWNPAHDLQAQDRAYRLGQQRDVRVYRLLSTSTIEEFVYLRQIYKQQLGSCSLTSKNVRRYFDGIHGDSRYYGELFGIRNLFSFRENGRSLTEELLEKQQQLEEKLRLKLEAPSREEATSVRVSRCAVLAKAEDNVEPNGASGKSGLAQLCEDVLEANCDDPAEEECNEWPLEKETPEDDKDNLSISVLLEKSGAVRHVVEHQEVVASSKMEEFVADCAIRDVLQKGINSQMPAYECSIETQEEVMPKKCEERSSSFMSRLKFTEIAKREYLTPVELATMVMSMSRVEKAALLNKHQKRQHMVFPEDATTSKRGRLPSESTAEVISAKKKAVEDISGNENTVPPSETSKAVLPEKEDPMNDTEIIVDANETDESNTLDKSEKPSSFEMDIRAANPSASKEAIQYMEQLIFGGSKCESKQNCVKDNQNPIKTTDLSNLAPLTSSKKSMKGFSETVESDQDVRGRLSPMADRYESTFNQEAIDAESGCSFTALAVIDSLFLSNTRRKPSPTKGSRKSLPVNFEASTSGLSVNKSRSSLHLIENSDSDSPDSVLNSIVELPGKIQYKLEDDVFLKLIESGKLKHL